MTNTNNDQIINKFIVDTIVINPIKEILEKLANGEFTDKDVNWLNTRLSDFTQVALNALNLKLRLPKRNVKVMNDHAKETFTMYFETLLGYFETIA